MKKLIIVLFTIFTVGNIIAQDFKGGVVKYLHIKKYDWKSTFGEFKDRGAQEWVASLPRERKMSYDLCFTEQKSLFEEDPSDMSPLPKKLQLAIMKSAYVQPPNPVLKKVYYDFDKNEMIRQMEFMTRDFLITNQIDRLPWKLTKKKIKVQDYICFGAELKKEEKNITAWFTPEIPVSTGPGEFYGLPGLILAVEVNGETTFLAKSIELNPPKESEISKPDDGKKVTPKEFENIVAMKIKEYKEMQKAKGGKKKYLKK